MNTGMSRDSLRTPLKNRHPQRTFCIFGDPGTSKEKIAAVQSDLRSSSRVQIHVEYCTRDKSKMLSLRPTSMESKYLETFNRIESSIMASNFYARRLKLRHGDVIEIYANSEGKSKAPPCSVASRIMEQSPELSVRTPAEVAFPRIGAFEITIFSQSNENSVSSQSNWKEYLIFSKLGSERWPHVPQLSRFIERLVFGAELHRVSAAILLQGMIRKWFIMRSTAIKVLQKNYRGARCRREKR